MKKLFLMLLCMFIIYFVIQFCFQFFGNGHKILYELTSKGNTYKITETYTRKQKKEKDNYYFEIILNETSKFTFQTYNTFQNNKHVIKRIESYQDDNITCILPIFGENKVIYDMMCMRDGKIYHYHDIVNDNNNLDSFVSSLENYNINQFKDEKENMETSDLVTFYPDNVISNHFLAVSNYQGVYTYNITNLKTLANIKMLEGESYNRAISGIVGKYYITADYDSEHEFDKFYYIDLVTNKVNHITHQNKISFDSYVQGVVDDVLYLFDRSNRKQYEVDMKKKVIRMIGDVSSGIKYYNNGVWEKKTANDAMVTNLLFQNNASTSSDTYIRIDTYGEGDSGFQYYYQKVGNQYRIYRSPVRDKDTLTYLFQTSNIENIIYASDYVYFNEGDDIKYYHDSTGIRTVMRYDELNFNKSLLFMVYVN